MTLPNAADALATRRAPLEMSSEEFRDIGHRLVDQLADRLSAVADGPVVRDESPAAVRQALGAASAMPSAGSGAAALVTDAANMLFDHSLFNAHPRFFGYITASPSPIGMFGDFIAAAVNQNVGAWRLAPLATEIEGQTVRWIAELMGYPTDCGGLLVSGGNMANFVCFVAARAAAAANIRTAGVAGAGVQLRVYASTETHTWIQKAADLFGLGTDAIRWIATDADQRLDVAALERQMEQDVDAGDRPCLVVGTAGTVSTGAIDPLPEMAAVCRRYGAWFHVDGAYGALAAQVPGTPASLRALKDADSVAVDPHKWLYAPLEAGCALVRDAVKLRNAFSYHPPYYHFDNDATNYFDYGPQNSRGFRALKVWLSLRHAGRAGHLQMIGDDIELARRLHERLAAHPEFQVMTQALSITTFRFVPTDLRSGVGSAAVESYLNRLNQQLLTALEKSGDAFLSNAVIGDTFALRACIVNFHTTTKDIDVMPGLLARLGHDVDAALRPG
jgi:glutamate/tyrosine decarboxylase-like PLP-dependent enzyme